MDREPERRDPDEEPEQETEEHAEESRDKHEAKESRDDHETEESDDEHEAEESRDEHDSEESHDADPLLQELVAHLRENRTELREEWARRISAADLLGVMSDEEIFSEATEVFDKYVDALETGSVENLQTYARDLSERIIPRGVETRRGARHRAAPARRPRAVAVRPVPG